MRSAIFLLLLLGLEDCAQAQWTFTLEPAVARPGDAVMLRVDDENGCFEVTSPLIERNGSIVTVRGTIDDSIPPGTPPGTCPPPWVTPRRFALGAFAAGSYEIRVVLCFNAPPPNECQLQASLPLTVVGSSGTFTVPGTSWSALLVLAGALCIVAVRRR